MLRNRGLIGAFWPPPRSRRIGSSAIGTTHVHNALIVHKGFVRDCGLNSSECRRLVMPSFDVVSEVDKHELTNSVDQASREISNRFDFKGADARIEQQDNVLTLHAESDFHIKQMNDVLNKSLAKRGIDIGCLEKDEIEVANMRARQKVTVREGIDKELAKKIVKLIKDSKLKVQASIQGEQVRVTGKKRDDLQDVIAMLKQQDLGLPLQFTNFRD
jgi:uncharacterized protein YajQ (UPF0234 family)